MVTSNGEAKENHPDCMGRYTLVRNTVVMQEVGDEVLLTSVYKKDIGEREMFLYLNFLGSWCMSDTVGQTACSLIQPNGDEFTHTPSKTLPWLYIDVLTLLRYNLLDNVYSR